MLIEGAYVFVAYLRADQVEVDSLVRQIEEWGIRLFVDRQLATGQSWESTNKSMVQSARALLVLMTSSSDCSPHVAQEIEWAREALVPVVPVLLSGSPWRSLADLQFSDHRKREPDELRGLIDFLGNKTHPFWTARGQLPPGVESASAVLPPTIDIKRAAAKWSERRRLRRIGGLPDDELLSYALPNFVAQDDPVGGLICAAKTLRNVGTYDLKVSRSVKNIFWECFRHQALPFDVLRDFALQAYAWTLVQRPDSFAVLPKFDRQEYEASVAGWAWVYLCVCNEMEDLKSADVFADVAVGLFDSVDREVLSAGAAEWHRSRRGIDD